MSSAERLPHFRRRPGPGDGAASRIGSGSIGGKASGLVDAARMIDAAAGELAFDGLRVDVPRLVVLPTDAFDAFVARNGLAALDPTEQTDQRIAHAFQGGELPAELVGDLRTLVGTWSEPIAVRSSSLLEDALDRPFAGVYATKMISNDQPSTAERFSRLAEAIKLVWASTWFAEARAYLETTGAAGEKMAIVLQEVVGRRRGERFYPDVSGVARSFNYYAVGGARPEDGVVNLALGLGKTIVDGGVSWVYSPARPAAPPPVASPGDLLDRSQREFWAVRLGRPPEWDPIRETEYLVRADLDAAAYDGSLDLVASTYDPRRDRMVPGVGVAGPRAVTFAPLLVDTEWPLNAAVLTVLELATRATGIPVEIEFALTIPPRRSRAVEPARLALLQMRPMVVATEVVEIDVAELAREDLVLASERAMGNGVWDDLRDVVYVRPDRFDAAATPRIAEQLAPFDRALRSAGRPYLLIGFGRWGSSDPWLGIPVAWSAIAGARVIVEATLPGMDVEFSQGAHFFHNLTSFRVGYLAVHHAAPRGIDWEWLAGRPVVGESEHVRHVRCENPLAIRLDGRTGRGAIWRRGGAGG